METKITLNKVTFKYNQHGLLVELLPCHPKALTGSRSRGGGKTESFLERRVNTRDHERLFRKKRIEEKV